MNRILVTGGAGFIGSNLTLELQQRYPHAQITVIDDFRSGSFQNLTGYKGDFIAEDISKLDWKALFKEPDSWDVIFHMASITDSTEQNQKLQVHDNVEGFRSLLEFIAPSLTPVVFASSAAVYGTVGGLNREEQTLEPANVYAFSKVILENLARHYARKFPHWRFVGLRYFNVYGPRESHKGAPSSMIYTLAQQMASGNKPRLFKRGEQRRDFIYVKDIVETTIAATRSKESCIVNVGTGKPRSYNDIVAILNKTLGTKLEAEYFDNPYPFYQPHTEASTEKSSRILGNHAKYTLEEGIKDYYESGWLVPAK